MQFRLPIVASLLLSTFALPKKDWVVGYVHPLDFSGKVGTIHLHFHNGTTARLPPGTPAPAYLRDPNVPFRDKVVFAVRNLNEVGDLRQFWEPHVLNAFTTV